MHGDLTRDTFDPRKSYTSVRSQQGRVMLDADHNEQADIQLHDGRQGRRDLVGAAGAPADEPGFGVTLSGGQPVVGAGRFIVDGIRVGNAAPVTLSAGQPFLPANTVPALAGTWLAYLDVWERPLTAVEEPSIREVALGGPDTTLRTQAVWQVRWLRLGGAGAAATCADATAALRAIDVLFDGTLEPGLEAGTSSGPCIVSEAAGFRGLENQLFRVEIHAGNVNADGVVTAAVPTAKWSRDNGAVVAGVVGLTSTSPIRLQIERLGPGGAAGFERGVTFEVKDEARGLAGQPGVLGRVDDVEGDVLRVSLLDGTTVAELQGVLAGARVVVRRWDSPGADPIGASFVTLEDGLRVRFDTGRRYRSGDFWLIPARTALLPGTSSQLDWPTTAPSATTYQPLPSRGPAHRRVALAILDRDGSGTWTVRSDCRQQFPPLTSVVSLAHAGGDGQHAPSGQWLPAPIAVVLARGKIPVSGATVRFRVTGGGGALSSAAPSSGPTGQPLVLVTTDAQGVARVHWHLGPGPVARIADAVWEPALAQTVEAVWLGAAAQPDGPALTFVAQAHDSRELHIAGGNGQQGRPGEILEVALRVRVEEGHRVVQNALVQFSILNRVFEGTPLDQSTGGSLHASARFVSGDTWPNGTRHHTVRTTTDEEGVAQVQWMLGTHLDLTTQRVEARLLDAGGQRTMQSVLFLAQLAIAREITWQPLVPWLAAVLAAGDRNVQAAVDTIATRLEQVAGVTTAFDPFLGLQWRAIDNSLQPLTPTTMVPLPRLAAIVFRGDLLPPTRDFRASTLHSGVRVYFEPPSDLGGTHDVVQVVGTTHAAPGRFEWTLSSEGRGALRRLMEGANGNGLALRVTVVPRWLAGGRDGDSTAVHETLFHLGFGR